MKYNFDIAFSESTFFERFILDFIYKKFKISKIKYQVNYEWIVIKDINEIKELKFDSLQFYLNKEVRFLVQKNNPNLNPRICLSELNFQEFNIIKLELERKYCEFIIFGQICEDIDKGLQNSDEFKYWKLYERNIPSYVEKIQNPSYKEGAPGMDMIPKEFISIESLPGHSHQMDYNDKLWFGSCWQMYFSPVYYKYIPKPLWDDYKNGYVHKVFENGLRRITLFEKIEDFDLPESRALQWAFRRQLGIDSIAHELTKSNNRIEPENLPVIITKNNCEKGQTRVSRYLDKNNNLIASNLAVKKETKEYLDDGITVVFEKTEAVS